MVPSQDTKFINMTPPVAILDDGSWATTEIDTKGWDYLQIVFSLGANDIAMTALAVTEADVTATSHANITGLITATSTNIDGTTSAFNIATTDNNTIALFEIDLRGRKRFIDLTATNGNGSSGGYASVLAILSRAEESPTTMAQRGCREVLRV
jgi:hypothetical protein